MKLMLKGIRCETAKCPIEKKQRNLAPGMHGWRKGRSSDYGVRLREKQKVKRYYGILEKQFMRCFRQAEQIKGIIGNLVTMAGGSARNGSSSRRKRISAPITHREPAAAGALPQPGRQAAPGNGGPKTHPPNPAQGISPEEVLPLDDNVFKDF